VGCMEWQNWNSSSPSPNNVKKVTVSGKGRATPIPIQFTGTRILVLARLSVSTIHRASGSATFYFQKGTLTLLNPVNGIVTGASHWEGHFNLKAVTALDGADQAAFGEPGS